MVDSPAGGTRRIPGEGAEIVEYAEHYERCCLTRPNLVQRWFMALLTSKARAIGQTSHKIWSLKYVLDTYFPGKTGLRVLDCGAWDGWFLSYDAPAIAQRIALDFDGHFAATMRAAGIDFVLADLEKGRVPFAADSMDLVALTSTLEHLSNPEEVAKPSPKLSRAT